MRFSIDHMGPPHALALSRDGKVQELSPTTQGLLGYAPEELEGRYFQDLVSGEDLEPLRRYLQGVLRGSMTEGIAIYLLHRNQSPRAMIMHCRALPHPQTQVLAPWKL